MTDREIQKDLAQIQCEFNCSLAEAEEIQAENARMKLVDAQMASKIDSDLAQLEKTLSNRRVRKSLTATLNAVAASLPLLEIKTDKDQLAALVAYMESNLNEAKAELAKFQI